MTDLAIIVVSYYNRSDIEKLIPSIDPASSDLSWHAVVVNNAVDDDLTSLKGVDDRVTIVDAGDNLGYSGGLNLGLRRVPNVGSILFLNPDITLTPASLATLHGAIVGGAAAAVPLIVDESGHHQSSLRREPRLLSALGDSVFGNRWQKRPRLLSETVFETDDYHRQHDIDWATGAVLAVSAETAQEVGPWDAKRFFMYSEETDYARRIRNAGGRISFVPSSVVEHRGGGSGSSAELDALLEVNRVRYFRKWNGLPASSLFALLILIRNLVRVHRAGSRQAVRALLRPQVRASLPGESR